MLFGAVAKLVVKASVGRNCTSKFVFRGVPMARFFFLIGPTFSESENYAVRFI